MEEDPLYLADRSAAATRALAALRARASRSRPRRWAASARAEPHRRRRAPGRRGSSSASRPRSTSPTGLSAALGRRAVPPLRRDPAGRAAADRGRRHGPRPRAPPPGGAPCDSRDRLVHAEVERLAAIPRLVRDPALHEAIDEIDVALDDLVARLDDSDPLTAEHSRAVSSWCARLAAAWRWQSRHRPRLPLRPGPRHRQGHDAERDPQRAAPPDRRGDGRSCAATPRTGAKIDRRRSRSSNHIVPAVRNHHERFDGARLSRRPRRRRDPELRAHRRPSPTRSTR